MARKPRNTGSIGPFRVTKHPDGRTEGRFERIQFPSHKAEIEEYIVRRFLTSAQERSAASGASFPLHSPVQLDENDYDFRIKYGQHDGYLELTEIVLPSMMKRDYPEVGLYDPTAYAEELFTSILRKKSDHYGRQTSTVYLLAYATHWGFILHDEVLTALRVMLQNNPLGFKEVYYFCPTSDSDGVVEQLYPVPGSLRRHGVLLALRGRMILPVSPERWIVQQSIKEPPASVSEGSEGSSL